MSTATFRRYALDPLRFGIARHPWRYLLACGGAYGALWTAVESLSYLLSDVRFRGAIPLGWLVGIAAVAGLLAIAQPRSVLLRVGAGNTSVRVSFGDLFSAVGHKVVPTNEYFDSALGTHVAPGSLHGRTITHYFSGHPHSFDSLVDASLSGRASEVVPRNTGRQRRYALGTTAVVPIKDSKLFLLALARTDLVTLKAHASVLDLWVALDGLWETLRIESHGEPISVPLVGGGLAGVPLPCTALLQCLLSSLHAASVKARVTGNIDIVLHEPLFGQIDLEVVRQQWS